MRAILHLVFQELSYTIGLIILIVSNKQRNLNELSLRDHIATELSKEAEKINIKLRKIKKNLQKAYSNVSPILASQGDIVMKKLKYLKF